MKNNPSAVATAAGAQNVNQNNRLVDRYSEPNPSQNQDVTLTAARNAAGGPNSAVGTGARDAAIAFSFAVVQHGAHPEAIRLALCLDSHGRPSALGAALDLLAEGERGP